MKNKLILLLLLTAGSMMTMYSQADYRKEAEACLKNGDYVCAKKNLQANKILRYDENADKLLELVNLCITLRSTADTLLEKHLYEEAGIEYKKILELNPIDEAVKQQIEKLRGIILHNAADLLYKKQLYAEAKAKYENILELNPEDKAASQHLENIAAIIIMFRNTADSLFAKGCYAEAAVEYEKIREIHPNDEYARQQIEKSERLIPTSKIVATKYKPEKIVVEPVSHSNKMALGVNLQLPVTFGGRGNGIGLGIGAKALYLVDLHFRMAGAFDYSWFDYGSRWSIGIYGHYLFYSDKSMAFYPLVGLGMESVKDEASNISYSVGNASVSLGGGAEFGLSENIALNIELIYRQNITDKEGTITYSGYSYNVYDFHNKGIKLSAGLIFKF